MRFYLPRRHRRKLLFPPGLLALAGLLWLGCVVVGSWQEKLKPKVVMQVMFLPVHLPPNYRNNFDAPQLMSVAQLQTFRLWHDAYFIGDAVVDAQEQERLKQFVQAMMADSAHDRGVRIRLASTSHYRNLVFILDLMARENVKRYRLDIQHEPVTLYAYTNVRLRPSQAGIVEFLCGTEFYRRALPVPSPPSAYETYFGELTKGFCHPSLSKIVIPPEWAASASLMVAIAVLGAWRMGQYWRKSMSV